MEVKKLLTKRRTIDIIKLIMNTIGTKKYMQDWCKENGVTMDEMEEFFNNAIRGTVLEAKRRRQK